MNASFKDLDTEVMWEAWSWVLLGNSNISSICMLCFCMVMCWVAAGANASVMGFTFPYFVSVLLVLCLLYCVFISYFYYNNMATYYFYIILYYIYQDGFRLYVHRATL